VKPIKAGNATITAKAGAYKDECTVYVIKEFITSTTAVGKAIDITTAAMVSSAYLNFTKPVYEVDLMKAMGKWEESTTLSNYERFEAAAGTTVSKMVKQVNSNNKVGYNGFGFSGSVQANYSAGSSETRSTAFVRAQAQVRVKDENIKGGINLKTLDMFVTDEFRNDLKSKSASDIIKAYGTHVIAHCYWGGVIQLDFSSSSKQLTNTTRLEIIVKASAFGVSGSSGNATAQEKSEFSSNSTYEMERYGGKSFGKPTVEGFYNGYSSWVNSVGTDPVVCGIDDFNELRNMIPIWKIAEQIDPYKAGLIEKEFHNRLAGNGTMIGKIDEGFDKIKTKQISSGQIMRDNTPGTTVQVVQGDTDIYSTGGKETKWFLELKVTPLNPNAATNTHVKLNFKYTVEEMTDSKAGKTILRMEGSKSINTGVTFTNKGEKKWYEEGSIIGKHHEWFIDRKNVEDDYVRQLTLRIDGDNKDDTGEMGFDVILNFNYVAP